MKISIVVPVYNVEKYIRQCLDSIERQTHTDFECILVDDGSTDSSGTVCNEYAKKDKRFRVVHKQNGGLVSARKSGVSEASCQYVCFVDSDDYIKSSYIKRFIDIIDQYSPDLIANNCFESFCGDKISMYLDDKNCGFYDNEKLENIKKKAVYDETLSKFNMGVIVPSLCLKCTKRHLLINQYESCNESISMGEDAMISFPLALCCKSIYITCFDGYLYRKNPNSIVNTFNPARFDMIKKLSLYLNDKMPSHRTQIANFTIYRLYSDIISAGKSSVKASEFASMLKNNFTNQEIKNHIKTLPPLIPLKNKAIIFLIKRRWWKLLYYIIKLF